MGGPCEFEISAENFMEMGKACQAHVQQMMQTGDAAHIEAVNKMMTATPEEQMKMMAEYQANFDSAPTI